MRRSVVTLTDSVTGESHAYEGVSLDQLAQNISILDSENLKISFGLLGKVTFWGRELNSVTMPIIADTVDGKPLTGYAPYYFVAKSFGDVVRPIPSIWCITIKPSE